MKLQDLEDLTDDEMLKLAEEFVLLTSSHMDSRLMRIATLYNSWADGDEPEGAPSARRTLLAIGEILKGEP